MTKTLNRYFDRDAALRTVLDQGWDVIGDGIIKFPGTDDMMVLVTDGEVDGHITWKWSRVIS